MRDRIDGILEALEAGRVNRRQAAAALAGLVTAMTGFGTSAQAESSSTFQATGLNHIALRVTDIPRSRDFYIQHLGLSVRRESASSCFLNCGDHFVALFRSSEPQMDHYCYAVKDYDVETAAEKLRGRSLSPRVSGRRIYFDDPDGLEVQLAAEGHQA